MRISFPTLSWMVTALCTVLFIAIPVSDATAKDDDSNRVTDQLDRQGAAPDFTLSGFDGEIYHLAEVLDSLPTLVWFTNLCAGCQANIPALDSIYRAEIKPQAALLAISLLDKDRKTVAEVSERLRFAFPILSDPGGQTCEDYVGGYAPGTCPAVNMFVVDRDRRIRLETHFPGKPLTEVLLLLRELGAPNKGIPKETDAKSGS